MVWNNFRFFDFIIVRLEKGAKVKRLRSIVFFRLCVKNEPSKISNRRLIIRITDLKIEGEGNLNDI